MILCCPLQHTHSEFWHIKNLVYSGIYRHIQVFLRDIHTYWAIIKTYSDIFSILCNPGIFYTLRNVDHAYSEPSHSRNSLFRHYLDIFSDLQNLVDQLHIQIFRILEYLEPFPYICSYSKIEHNKKPNIKQ